MRAIIIEDKDAKSLLCKLELAKLRTRIRNNEQDVVNDAIGEMHGLFYYEVVKWLQEQGCHLT